MLHLWNIRYVFLNILFIQLHIHYGKAIWPSLDTSNVQLLGIFSDKDNASELETTTLSVHSRAMFKAAIVLAQQFNITVQGQFIGWKTIQTGGATIDALSNTCRVMSTSNITGIVGPSYSRETPIIAALAQKTGIPAISYSATDPQLSDENTYPAFYRTVPSDNITASALVKLFLRYNWTSCTVIYQNDIFGTGGVDAINHAFNINNLTVSKTFPYDISTSSFRDDLKNTLLTSFSRIIILWAEPQHTTSILQHAIHADVLGPHFLWILSSSVSLNSFNQTLYPKLLGILTIEPTTASTVDEPFNSTLLNHAYTLWQQYEPETFPGIEQVDNYALFAFDATWTLILSLQKLCSTYMTTSCLSFVQSSFCFDRRFIDGNEFLQTISNIDFVGVTGSIIFRNDSTDRMNGSYYIVKNVQPSGDKLKYVSVLQWSDFGDWKLMAQAGVIVWPGSSLTAPSGLPGLTGITLRIAVVPAAPFAMITDINDRSGEKSIKMTGYVLDLIELLEARMGFTSEFIVVPSNSTIDQIMDAITDDVYDIVIGGITITSKRREIVDFSSPIFDNSLRVIVRYTTGVNINLFSYMRPFSNNLWFLILGALLYSAILVYVLERKENDALKDKPIISAAALSLWFAFCNMAGYGADFNVQTAAGRLLNVGLYILSLILVATYTANLASDLTAVKTSTIINSIDDIKNGKIPFSRVGIIVGSSAEDYYLRAVSSNNRNFYPLHTTSETYSALLNNHIDASIMDIGIAEYSIKTTYCNLTLVGTDFDQSSYGIAMRKGWPYAGALDINILSLRESGALDDLRKKWFEGQSCSDSSRNTTDPGSFTGGESLVGLFIIFAVISILALLLFVWFKRSVIRDCLYKLIQQKGWFFRKANSPPVPLTEDYYESPKSGRSDLIPLSIPRF